MNAPPIVQLARRPVGDASPEPPVRGEGLLKLLERPFTAADRAIDTFLPEDLNPFARTGAIANTTFIVALVSGILLLLWYVPSIHQSWDSVVAMDAQPWTAGLVRSLHRYSSDACVFFLAVHALKLFFARRFGGSRWLAWVTGVFVIGVLWLTGWTGYWLVWDERARQIALATAKFLDVLPIFIDPLSRSFLVDERVNTLLFFVIFFIHMLVPFAAVVALWLHITRLARANWITGRVMTAWIVGSLVLLSVALPADTAGPARLAVEPGGFPLDWWYLAPLVLAERMSVGLGWALLLGVGAVGFVVPWARVGAPASPAGVEASLCNSCRKCEADCPYSAISMVPREDDKPFESQALVDEALCVGCSICTGSCDTGGVGVPAWPSLLARKTVGRWMAEALVAGRAESLAVLCADGAGELLEVDEASGRCDALPGWRILPVPCAGWVHPLLVERALRSGAKEVVIGACGPANCRFREGPAWIEERLDGRREPELRRDKVDASAVRVVRFPRGGVDALIEALDGGAAPPPSRRASAVAGVGLAAAIGVVVAAMSVGPWWPAAGDEPVLVVSFKHPGRVGEDCRVPSAEELANTPVHMRRERICERRRADVRLRVHVDGELVLDRAYPPKGIWGDGNSIALETLAVAPGPHEVRVQLGDRLDASAWDWTEHRTLEFRPRERRVVLFGRNDGFDWW